MTLFIDLNMFVFQFTHNFVFKYFYDDGVTIIDKNYLIVFVR